MASSQVFQSTPSLRKVTLSRLRLTRIYLFQSTPSLRKVTITKLFCQQLDKFQSTPSLRKVTMEQGVEVEEVEFQSTPSLRKVTNCSYNSCYIGMISIHTFLAEGDKTMLLRRADSWYFNPHLPCGR